MATVFVSMATRLSDLGDQKPGVNIQTKGHTLTPPSGWNGPEAQEVFGSAQSCSPSWSLARKPTTDWPKTQYCLEIQVPTLKMGEQHHHPSHLAGVSCGRHGPRWQIQPNRGSCDRPRLGHPVLWVAIIRRRT